MDNAYDKLDTQIIHRSGGKIGTVTKRESYTIDFIVNGRSLYESLGAKKFDMIGRFSKKKSRQNREAADVYMLEHPADLKNGRTMFFVCGECGDIGCGAITGKISKTSEGVIWSEFGYENDRDPEGADLESYKLTGPFKFEEKAYKEVISKLR